MPNSIAMIHQTQQATSEFLALAVLKVGLLIVAFGLYDMLWPYFSGWARWARNYGSTNPPPGGTTFRSKGLRFGRYPLVGKGLRITIEPRGLYLKPRGWSSLFQPPLMLPWKYFKHIVLEESRWIYPTLKLSFAGPEGWRMTASLPGTAVSAVRTMSGRSNFSDEALR